jgi:hypothetical protein
MRNLLLACGLGLVLSLGGCNRGGEPLDIGVGDAGISGGTGGEGSGPTGTQGGEPALNPAADSPDDKGTGGP